MIRDPIVDEVRAIREELAARFNFDIRKIVEDAQGGKQPPNHASFIPKAEPDAAADRGRRAGFWQFTAPRGRPGC